MDGLDLNANMKDLKLSKEEARMKMKAAVFTVVATGKFRERSQHHDEDDDDDEYESEED